MSYNPVHNYKRLVRLGEGCVSVRERETYRESVREREREREKERLIEKVRERKRERKSYIWRDLETKR